MKKMLFCDKYRLTEAVLCGSKTQTRRLQAKLCSAQDDVEHQCSLLKRRVKWLKNIEKESHPEAIKELIRLMYMLIEAKDLYLFKAPYTAHIDIRKFNILDPVTPLFDREDGQFRLLSLYPDVSFKITDGVHFCFSDGFGSHYPIKLFNDKQKLTEFVIQYINNLPEISEQIIKECQKFGIQIPKDKLIEYYQSSLRYYDSKVQENKNSLATWQSKQKETMQLIETLK